MPVDSPHCTEELGIGSDDSSSTPKETSHIISTTPENWPPKEWEVSKVIGEETVNGVKHYLLMWMPSWVPEAHIDGVHAGAWLHEEEWGISEILEARVFVGVLYYLVEWIPSWVSELDARNASELVKEWHATWRD
jgi:hypothetical protein